MPIGAVSNIGASMMWKLIGFLLRRVERWKGRRGLRLGERANICSSNCAYEISRKKPMCSRVLEQEFTTKVP
jgi:hypothetical protein